MEETAHGQVANKSMDMADKAEDNPQIANLYMALVGRIIMEAVHRGKPISGVRIGGIMVNGMMMTATLAWGTLISGEAVPFIQSRYSDIKDFVESKAKGMAVALRRNPDFIKFLNDMVGTCERIASFKGIPFKDLKVGQAFLTKDADRLVVELLDGRIK